MKKKKILFLGIMASFFTLASFNYSYSNNKFDLKPFGISAKAEEAPIMKLNINDGQTYTSGDVDVNGWALNASGVKAVDVYVDGVYTKTLSCNVSTPDVHNQFPDYTNSANSGYEYKLSLKSGSHVIRVYNIGNDGTVIYREAKISVNAPNTPAVSNAQTNSSLEGKIGLNIDNGQVYKSGSAIDVRGWAISGSGIKAVDVYVDGKYTKTLAANLSRPDVKSAFPNYPNSANSGYDYSLVLPDGAHTIRVYGIGNNGKNTYTEAKVVVNSSNNAQTNSSLEAKIGLNIDNGQVYKSGNAVDVRGWAISGSGIKAVDVYVDGKYTKTLAANLSRPDVKNAFPNYPNSANSGYDYSMVLPDGAHTIRVYGIGNDGKNTYTEAKVVVNSSNNVPTNSSLEAKIGLNIDNGQAYKNVSAVDVRGWAISGSGIKAVDVYVDGKYAKTLAANLSRPDVKSAFPNYPNSANSGYDYAINLPNGSHTIRVYGISNDGKNAYTEVNVYVDNNNNIQVNPSLQSKVGLNIDDEQVYKSGSTIDVRGWAISGSGIKAVDVYVDGKYTKTLAANLSRPDVKNAFPNYPNAENSGYDYGLTLPDGTHTINVYAIGNDGKSVYQEVVVYVGYPYDGRNQSPVQLKLLNYLTLSRENRDSVKTAAIALHDGNSSNTCVYFSSEALRRVGLGIPKYVANTHEYTDVLSSLGWVKCDDYKKLIPGDICFTRNDSTGYPTHTYVFVGWTDNTDTTAYIVDNQDDLYGDELHQRVIPYETSAFDKFQYFFYSIK